MTETEIRFQAYLEAKKMIEAEYQQAYQQAKDAYDKEIADGKPNYTFVPPAIYTNQTILNKAKEIMNFVETGMVAPIGNFGP